MKKLIIFIFITFISILLKPLSLNANTIDGAFINGAKSGILMEESTGEILYEKNIHEKLSPASMTKIMTLLLIYEAIDNNILDKHKMLVVPEYAASMGGSQVYLEVGEQISVDEAIKSLCVASANDCAVLLAMEIEGSEAHFVQKMNQKALELGCKNTCFSDCTGLSKENHYSSAYDMALISRELVTKYPDVLNYTNIQEDYIRKDTDNPFWLVNTNKMVGRVDGLNGLKTGYTSFSGYCITLHMQQNNMKLISVVFGYDKSTTRNSESLELLKYGFNNYKLEKVLAKDLCLKSIDHILYKNKFDIVIKEDIYYLCKKNEKNEYSYKYKYNDSYNGTINIYLGNNIIANGEITTDKEVKKKNLWEVMCSIFKECFIF